MVLLNNIVKQLEPNKNSTKMIRLRNFLDSLGLIDIYNDTKFSIDKIKDLEDHKKLVANEIIELSKYLKKEIVFNGIKVEITKLVKFLDNNYREQESSGFTTNIIIKKRCEKVRKNIQDICDL